MTQVILGIFIGFLIALMFLFSLRRSARKRAQEVRAPFTDKLLRPPGESTRLKIIELDEQLGDRVLWFLASCMITGVWFVLAFHAGVKSPMMLLVYGPIAAGAVCGCFVLFRKANRTSELLRNYNLGFIGERAVGEELARLLETGYKVFHDVPFEGKISSKPFNVDHVVVGQSGVFVVETKTRRKRIRKGADDPKNIVAYDGELLHFPWGSDSFGINQVRENAIHISNWLTKTAGVGISAIPILALPGWSVERRGRGDVRVVSGREVCSALPSQVTGRPALTEEEVKRVAAQLEQKCRDVSL